MENSWRNYISSYNIIFLLVVFVIYIVNQNIIKGLTDNVIVHSYLNDLLAMNLLLPFSNILLWSKGKGIYSLKNIYIFTLLVGIEWEYVTPLYKGDSISDLKDIVAYFLGATLYYILYKTIKRPAK